MLNSFVISLFPLRINLFEHADLDGELHWLTNLPLDSRYSASVAMNRRQGRLTDSRAILAASVYINGDVHLRLRVERRKSVLA